MWGKEEMSDEGNQRHAQTYNAYAESSAETHRAEILQNETALMVDGTPQRNDDPLSGAKSADGGAITGGGDWGGGSFHMGWRRTRGDGERGRYLTLLRTKWSGPPRMARRSPQVN